MKNYTPSDPRYGDTITIVEELDVVNPSNANAAAKQLIENDIVIKGIADGKQDPLIFDETPTSDSVNPVTSGGVYTAINTKQNKLTFDTTPTSGSTNPVTSGGVYTAISNTKVTGFVVLDDAGSRTMSIGNVDTIKVLYATGTVTVSSSSSARITASISNGVITLKGVGATSGTVTITVKVAASGNYSAASKTISVTYAGVSKTLNENPWSAIKSIGAAGTGANYWSVGDTKDVEISGTVGTKAISGTYKVFIANFNYRGTNGVYFQGFKDSNGVDIALCDDKYGSNYTNGAKYYNMNHWGNYNYGGWKGCDLRYDVLGSTDKAPSGYGSQVSTSREGYDATSEAITSPVANTLMAALPSDLRSALAQWTIYTDNKGNSSNVAANVTTSVDYLPLLAEYEIHGARSYANQYEYTDSKQSQMDYYKNGNSKAKNWHTATTTAVYWWARSANYYNADYFCYVNTSGGASNNSAYYSFGLAPAFRVA